MTNLRHIIELEKGELDIELIDETSMYFPGQAKLKARLARQK